MRVSVVVGFRDWGAGRLELAARSVLESLAGLDGQLIVSDYGSRDPEPARAVAAGLGVAHVYTPVQGPWSRSRALNAGFALSDGDLLVSTDADMLFAPGTFPRVVRTARRHAGAALFMQCRDLPVGMDDQWLRLHRPDWADLERAARLRPRWGMGGMMAIPRAGFEALRGFDERFHTYGGEDLDLALRARRAGYRTVWVDHPEARMYHMWHPSSKTAADCAPGGREAVEANRRILTQDPSWVRNVVGWRHPLPDRGPLVTVAIATRDRAGLLRETLASVLLQTVEDFEVVVVDDGSQDSTRDVVESFADPRLRYARQDPAGISAARNHALDISRGRYTAVLDDDDLMHPRRLEWQLAALEGDAVGTVGAFVNFDDTTGTTSLCLGRRPVREATSGIGGAPGHGTWMIRTDVMRAVRYDETLATGVDNDFMLRLLRTGAHLVHTGKALTLRRLHPQQVSRCQTSGPSAASRRSLGFLDFRVDPRTMEAYEESLRREGAFPHVEDTSALVDSIRPYLPDGLVRRELDVDCSGVEARELELLRARLEGRGSLRSLMVDGRLVSRHLLVSGATYEDMGVLRRAGLGWEAAVVEACDDPAQVTAGRHDLGWLAEVLSCGPIGGRRWRCVVVLPGGRGEPSPQDPAVEVHELCRRVEDREERWCLWLVMEPIDVLALPGAQGAWFVVGDPAQDPTGPDQEVPA